MKVLIVTLFFISCTVTRTPDDEMNYNHANSIDNFEVNINCKYIILTWSQNESGVRLVRNSNNIPINLSDGDVVYEGTNHYYKDYLKNGISYSYKLYSKDYFGNYSYSKYIRNISLLDKSYC